MAAEESLMRQYHNTAVQFNEKVLAILNQLLAGIIRKQMSRLGVDEKKVLDWMKHPGNETFAVKMKVSDTKYPEFMQRLYENGVPSTDLVEGDTARVFIRGCDMEKARGVYESFHLTPDKVSGKEMEKVNKKLSRRTNTSLTHGEERIAEALGAGNPCYVTQFQKGDVGYPEFVQKLSENNIAFAPFVDEITSSATVFYRGSDLERVKEITNELNQEIDKDVEVAKVSKGRSR